MRWSMPVLAVMLAIAIGLFGPGSARSAGPVAPRLTLEMPLACAAPMAAPGKEGLLVAASLRGWAEGPTARAWRALVAWTKQGGRFPLPGC